MSPPAIVWLAAISASLMFLIPTGLAAVRRAIALRRSVQRFIEGTREVSEEISAGLERAGAAAGDLARGPSSKQAEHQR